MKHPNQFDLGLALSRCSCHYGVPKTQAEIANWCIYDPTTQQWKTISRQRIEQVERQALRKIRKHLHCHPELREELAGIFGL